MGKCFAAPLSLRNIYDGVGKLNRELNVLA